MMDRDKQNDELNQVLGQFDPTSLSTTGSQDPLAGLSTADLYFYFVWQETRPERLGMQGSEAKPRNELGKAGSLALAAGLIAIGAAVLFLSGGIIFGLICMGFGVVIGFSQFQDKPAAKPDNELFMSVKPARIKLRSRNSKLKFYRNDAGALVVKYRRDPASGQLVSQGLHLYHANGQLQAIVPDRKMSSTEAVLIDTRELLALWWPNANRFFVDEQTNQSSAWDSLPVASESVETMPDFRAPPVS